jgi:hypothetical protein
MEGAVVGYHSFLGSSLWAAALFAAISTAQAWDESKYPNLKGQWRRLGPANPIRFDTMKPPGRGQEAPLTPEYQSIYEASLADQAAGGQGYSTTHTCSAPGMPRIMNLYGLMEIVVTPETTHILIDHIHDNRRIHTDGRKWSEDVERSFAGYSIGNWIDREGLGRYDVLEVETRGFKGPRSFDTSGIPLHKDNQTVIKERIYLNKSDPHLLHDEITVIDNALTRPWSVTKNYRRVPIKQPVWREVVCTENNNHVEIGRENYFLSADGYLMPTKKGQPPPDLRYFNMRKE